HPSGDWIVFQAAKPAPHPQLGSDPAVGQHNDIWVIPPAGGAAHKLYRLPCTLLTHYALLQPGFSLDGAKLCWGESYSPPNPADPWGRWRMVIADFDASGDVPSLGDPVALPDLGHPGYREVDEFLTTEQLLVS